MYKLLLCWRYLLTRYLALVCIVSVLLGVRHFDQHQVVSRAIAGLAADSAGGRRRPDNNDADTIIAPPIHSLAVSVSPANTQDGRPATPRSER